MRWVSKARRVTTRRDASGWAGARPRSARLRLDHNANQGTTLLLAGSALGDYSITRSRFAATLRSKATALDVPDMYAKMSWLSRRTCAHDGARYHFAYYWHVWRTTRP